MEYVSSPRERVVRESRSRERDQASQDESEAPSMDFRKKIGTVRAKMKVIFPDLNWEQQVTKPSESISVDPVEIREDISLPQAGEVVPNMFENYVKELRAEEGTRRGKSTPGQVLEQKAMVNRHKLAVHKRYKVVDCPWNVRNLENPKIQTTSLYVTKATTEKAQKADFPELAIKTSQVKDWEIGNRELLNVLNYEEWFVGTAKRLITDCMNKINKVGSSGKQFDPSDLALMWKLLNESYGLLDSAGKCIYDTNRATVDQICSQVLVRRDSWLARMAPEISQQGKEDLRCCDFNGKSLFGQDELDRAKKSMKENKLDKAQTSLLESQAKLSQQMRGVSAAVNRKPPEKKDLQPFQGAGGGGATRKPFGENQKSNYQRDQNQKEKDKYTSKPPRRQFGNRGGGGGGRGRH